jgi:drug/metabolite transporter (DMT)-like permease
MSIDYAAIATVLAVAMIWKGRAPRFRLWLLLIGGVCLASIVLGFIGPAGWTIAGIAIAVPATVVLAYLFYEEGIKRNGLHKFRSPAIAFALGVMLVATHSGAASIIGGVGQHAGTSVTNVVQK